MDYVEGHELGELYHSREKGVPLEMDKFSQLLVFFVGEGDLKRSVVFVFWLFALKTGLGNNTLCTYLQPCIMARESLPWLLPCAYALGFCQPESPKEILEILLCL